MPFPRPFGATGNDAQNFMHRRVCLFSRCAAQCMKFYVPPPDYRQSSCRVIAQPVRRLVVGPTSTVGSAERTLLMRSAAIRSPTPWLSLWESCRRSRLRGPVGADDSVRPYLAVTAGTTAEAPAGCPTASGTGPPHTCGGCRSASPRPTGCPPAGGNRPGSPAGWGCHTPACR